MNDLGFWMAMFTLGALAYYGTPLGRLIRAGARLMWVSSQALLSPPAQPDEQPRDVLGRYASLGEPVTTGGNDQEQKLPAGNGQVTALECGVTTGNDVTEVVTIQEAVYITMHLVEGVAPSNVIKQLPGFTPKHYDRSKAKVDRIKALLAEARQE
jgi:hypothetical protein